MQREEKKHPDPQPPMEGSRPNCTECGVLRRALAQNKAELDAFVYRVSHDLKAPVVSLQGMASILLEDYQAALGERGRHYLGRLMSNAELIERLLADLLIFSRVGRKGSNPERLHVGEVVQEVLNRFSDEIAKGKIEVRVCSPLPALFFDRAQLEQVLSQLISNAIQFMGDRQNPMIEIGATSDGEAVTFFVRDNGIGIDPQYHETIFGVFERLKEIETEGTGMGLALVRKILNLAGGTIWLESEKKKGAVFFFRVPDGVLLKDGM